MGFVYVESNMNFTKEFADFTLNRFFSRFLKMLFFGSRKVVKKFLLRNLEVAEKLETSKVGHLKLTGMESMCGYCSRF